ncbi:caspase-8-like [Sinocyclocheilus anshuiensis]|uniref:Caspase-8 n=1 Tax=Sinocyclocheilus anshuiensis TaxID=1608454 RepID=A0A671M9B9_9TELE|nr:PREDICTED: caspase-8-like [Sinocyclocheilus anshuiensis]
MGEKESFNRIRQNKTFLLETLSEDPEIILQHVQQANLVTQRDYRNLSDITKREEKVINLLDKLMGKGEDTCRQFIDLLRQDCILASFPKLKDRAVIAFPAMPHTSPVQEVSQYKIEQIPRGICVIINNVDFATMDERRGSDEDQKSLAEVFHWLGFKVVEHRNKTAAEMKNLLKDVGKTVDGDCFVCCILSHGIKEGVCGTDGAVISVDEIREPFNGNNCQRLAGKPKLFVIQACRGKRNQQRVHVQADAPDDGESEMEEDGDDFDITIPADTDFLIARSTTDGHLSYRRPKEGSWFIQSLCRNLKQHCPTGKDIQTILLSVNNEVSSQGIRSKQMPVQEVAMRKMLVLLPV